MFEIGDAIFYATVQWQPIQSTCPICYGKLKVTLILGNGDSVELPCEYCKRGCEGPFGVVSEYDYLVEATPYTITRISSEITSGGEKRQYHSASGHCLDDDKCYATRDEALAAAIAIKAKQDEEHRTRAEYLKYNAKKSFSWNAGYHEREAGKNRKQADYHDKMAVLCKARSKEEGK